MKFVPLFGVICISNKYHCRTMENVPQFGLLGVKVKTLCMSMPITLILQELVLYFINMQFFIESFFPFFSFLQLCLLHLDVESPISLVIYMSVCLLPLIVCC